VIHGVTVCGMIDSLYSLCVPTADIGAKISAVAQFSIGSKSNDGIVGGALGAVGAIALGAAGFVVFKRYKRNNPQQAPFVMMSSPQ